MYTFDKNKMREVLKTYLGNEHWKSVYQGAPSDECKQFFRLNFYSSMTGEPSGDELSEVRCLEYRRLEVFAKNTSGHTVYKSVRRLYQETSGQINASRVGKPRH